MARLNLWKYKSFLFIFIALFSISNCEKSEDNFEKYKEIFNRGLLRELSKYVQQNTTEYSSSLTECGRDILKWSDDFLVEKWPIRMLDSDGKIPPGLLTLNIQSYGQFDECLAIDHHYQDNHLDRQIKGKYCLAKIPIPNVQLMPGSTYHDMIRIENLRKKIIPKNNEPSTRLINTDAYGRRSLIMAICLPHTCKMEEIETMLEKILSNSGISIKPSITIPESECVTAEPPTWTSTDWGALAFFIFFGVLIVLSTGYDVIITHILKKDIESSVRHDVLVSFSVWTNTSKLMKVNNNARSLKCLHGLRSLSLLWVIIGHRYISSIITPIMNNTYIIEWLGETGSMVIYSGPFSVDTFFVLSGLLVAYICFRQLERKQCFNFPLLYLHRFLRLTPALAAVVFFQASLYRYTSNGPIWNTLVDVQVANCEKYWWSTLLYVQNYVNPVEMCIGQTWYLSCDMQYFILSPIIIYPFLKWRRVGWINIAFWIILSQIGVFVVSYKQKWEGNAMYATNSYFTSHTRATPWLLGFALGYALHLLSKATVKINKVVVVVGWIICLVIMGLLVFGMKPFDTKTKTAHLLYDAFSKTAWSIAVMWLIIACTFGYGGPINWFLSLKVWEILGRLSYSMYLVHGFVQNSISVPTRHPVYFTNFNTVMIFFSDVVLTIFMAYLLTISFELPFIALEKILFNKKKPNVMEKKKLSISANVEIPIPIETIEVKN